MRLIVAAVGRLKSGGERELFCRYRDRLQAAGRPLGLAPVTWHEIAESRAPGAAGRRAQEGARLLQLVRDADVVIAVDAKGEMLGSQGFARLLGTIRDGGARAAGLLMGGADGLAADVADRARIKLSFGPITLPHQLARIVLAEQLYRAATILAGHPYHRD